MANYICTFRTNYFKVKDDKKFEEFMSHVYADVIIKNTAQNYCLERR